jgi:hypothetical protein
MEAYQIFEVTKKLIGKIQPIGETNEDNRRFENLKQTIELIELLIVDVELIANNYSDRVEFSARRSGQHAAKFLKDYGIREFR